MNARASVHQIKLALEKYGGNVEKAAVDVGIYPTTLHQRINRSKELQDCLAKIKEYGIELSSLKPKEITLNDLMSAIEDSLGNMWAVSIKANVPLKIIKEHIKKYGLEDYVQELRTNSDIRELAEGVIIDKLNSGDVNTAKWVLDNWSSLSSKTKNIVVDGEIIEF